MLKKSHSFDMSMLQNPFYSDLSMIMENKMFQNINQKYLGRWSDIEVFILYVKLYEAIKNIVKNPEDIIKVIHILMSHTESRRQLITLFEKYKKEEELFSNVLHQFITEKETYLNTTLVEQKK